MKEITTEEKILILLEQIALSVEKIGNNIEKLSVPQHNNVPINDQSSVSISDDPDYNLQPFLTKDGKVLKLFKAGEVER